MKEAHRQTLDRAQTQHGLLTRGQAIDDGLTARSIVSALSNGLLIPVASGVYRVRGAPETLSMAMMGATLAAAGQSSFRSAAHLWRLDLGGAANPLCVTVDAAKRQPRLHRLDLRDDDHKFFAVKVRRSRAFDESQRVVDGIAVTDPYRTIIDLAATLSSGELEAAFERARHLGLVSIEGLKMRHGLIGGQGRRGSARIRELLASTAPNALESKLEVKAWRMLRNSRVAQPARQFWVIASERQRYRLDFAWPQLRVAFETEGFEWHGTQHRWKRDRIRTAALERLGWRIVVATWDDVVRRPTETVERIQAALVERSAAA